MAEYSHRLPSRPLHKERTPWMVMSELAQLHLRFFQHHLENTVAFFQEYEHALPPLMPASVYEATEYVEDALQRHVLFWDTIRKRGNNFIEAAANGNPPVLAFDYEVVLDAEDFDDPSNYLLVRIIPPQGTVIDPEKRPFIIVDPRAGHTPGIGGFKADSQVGIALKNGHPVYFVIFKMHPVPGQTLRDVAQAEIQFLHWVAEHHAHAPKPCVLGNCQGGWAIMAVAAMRPDLAGPLVLSGAPLSYWAGATGKNPMRYLGGLMGGSWLAYFASDIGNGEFDGANLVANFEALNPANTIWDKYYHLYSKIDTEQERFLDFERWWGSYIFLTFGEIRATLDNLFIGNKLSHGQIATGDAFTIDLRQIKQPIIVFCSEGDNITPPQQALNWIADLYKDEKEIIANGQVIVYMIHGSTGHLGIFVSSAIIKREQQQIASMLDQIEALPPGLYEMTITDKVGHETPIYDVRLEHRAINDLLNEGGKPVPDEKEFQLVRTVSEVNASLYELFVSPWMRAIGNPMNAEIMQQLNPLRIQHYALSDINPIMWPFKWLAPEVKEVRAPVDTGNPLVKLEQANSLVLNFTLNTLRDMRDIGSETLFYSVYGILASNPFIRLFAKPAEKQEALLDMDSATQNILATASKGDFVDAALRVLLLLTQARGYLTRQDIDTIRHDLLNEKAFSALPKEEQRERLNRQTVIVAYRPALAISTLPALLPNASERKHVIQLIEEIGGLTKAINPAVATIWRQINEVLDMNVKTPKSNQTKSVA